MMRATHIVKRGTWHAEARDRIVLDFDYRHRRRIALTAVNGTAFLLDLAEVPSIQAGDGMVLSDGSVIAVEAAPEDLLEITCRDPLHHARVAWHLGNRHLPTEIMMGRMRIRADHVIADMLRGLGASITPLQAPFNPENGAYAVPARSHAHHDDDHGQPHHHHGHTHAHD